MNRWSQYILPTVLALLTATSSFAGSATLTDAVRAYLQDTWRLNMAEHEIEFLSTQIKIDSLGEHILELRPLTQGEPRGLFTLMAELKDQGKLIGRGQIRLRIRKFAEVLVARDRLPRHSKLIRADFEIKRVEITSLREQPVRQIKSMSAFRLKRNLSRGNILTLRSIEPVPDIDVGREVSILFSGRLFQISAPGRALQAGAIGDIVKVKNLSSGRIVRARVLDKNTVTIES